MLPGYFYAPASGLIAVGVFSLITPLLGCVAAIRHQASLLCIYIAAASFVLILQFSFGAAAATVANMDHVPGEWALFLDAVLWGAGFEQFGSELLLYVCTASLGFEAKDTADGWMNCTFLTHNVMFFVWGGML